MADEYILPNWKKVIPKMKKSGINKTLFQLGSTSNFSKSAAAACSCQISREKDSRENYEQTFGKLFPGTFCAQQENTKSQNILGSVPAPAKDFEETVRHKLLVKK